MSNEQKPHISVIEPIGPAIDRVTMMLFKPFNLERWFVIGFCAWLAYLESSGGSGPNFGYSKRSPVSLQEVKNYVLDNLIWLIGIGFIVMAVVIGLWILVTWLSSRGKFMFLHCVVENKAEVRVPWRKFCQHAYSLFVFRIVLFIISFLIIVLLSLAMFFLIMATKKVGGFTVIPAICLAVSILLIVFSLLIISLVVKFTDDFVVPLMFMYGTSCVGSWRYFLSLLSGNKGAFILYLLFQIVISIVIVGLILVVSLATCCCACCMFAIPYVGTVLLLPIFIFKRSYPLFYLRQFGNEFDIFRQVVVDVPKTA